MKLVVIFRRAQRRDLLDPRFRGDASFSKSLRSQEKLGAFHQI